MPASSASGRLLIPLLSGVLVKVDDMAGAMSVVGIRLLSDEEEEGVSRQVRDNECVVVVAVVAPCSKRDSPAGSGRAGGSR